MEDVKALEATFLLCQMQHKSVAGELRRLLETGPSNEETARVSHVKAFMALCDRKGKAARALEAAARELQHALEPPPRTRRPIIVTAFA